MATDTEEEDGVVEDGEVEDGEVEVEEDGEEVEEDGAVEVEDPAGHQGHAPPQDLVEHHDDERAHPFITYTLMYQSP